jgi:hypothetical protein
MPSGSKYIYDPIHGSVTLEGAVLDLVNHPLLQRLWGIKQTGMAHLVFPGAGHSRLEHSLGVLWVVREMARGLGLDDKEKRRVELAGLLHDIGHTPFSHSLGSALEEVTGLDHEEWTVKLINGDLSGGFGKYGQGIPGYEPTPLPEVLSRHGIKAKDVASLLKKLQRGQRSTYLDEMLHGTIDADRLDYMERDAHYTGVAHGAIDSSRLMETLRISNGHLAFAEKGRSAVEGFLVARSLMYATVYYNKTVRIAEAMILSAVERFPRYPDSARELLSMTDGDLLSALGAAGGRAREMAMRLKVRSLFKRAFVIGEERQSKRWENLACDPVSRRKVEDELADLFHGRPGDVIIDAVKPATSPREDVIIAENDGPRNLLQDDPFLAHMVRRSPTRWNVAVYTSPRLREDVTRQGRRALEKLSP